VKSKGQGFKSIRLLYSLHMTILVIQAYFHDTISAEKKTKFDIYIEFMKIKVCDILVFQIPLTKNYKKITKQK
jgi:hypothetical protein